MNRFALLSAVAGLLACGDTPAQTPPKTNEAPVANITAPSSDVALEVGASVAFSGTCTDPEGATVAHHWDFAAAAPASTLAEPGTIVFADAGTFLVSYTCSDAEGLTTPALTRTVTVTRPVPPNTAPVAVITAPANDLALDVGASVTFSATCTDPEGAAVTHRWDFADVAPPSTLAAPAPITFSDVGTFVVSYTCSDAEGLAAPAVTRTISVTRPPNAPPSATLLSPEADVAILVGDTVAFAATCDDPEGATVTHRWDFDDAADPSSLAEPGAIVFDDAGTFVVSYLCSDAEGLAAPSITRAITVTPRPPNVAPNAGISVPAGNVLIAPGDSVTFQGTCLDPEGAATTHLWDFDGGATDSTAASPGPVVFAAAGTFKITYVCSDAEGLADPTPAKRTITVVAPNLPPSGTIVAPSADVAVEAGDSVTFTGSCTDPDGTPDRHHWEFGAGAINSTLQSPGPSPSRTSVPSS